MQFLYYRPGHTRNVTLDDVNRWGLNYAFDSPPVPAECMNNTPDGNHGRVFVASGFDEVPQVNLEKQTWRKLPGIRDGGDLYVGVWNDDKPTPDELVRNTTLPGYSYSLLDRHDWVVPLVLEYTEEGHECALPRLLDFDDEGNPISGDVVEKYRHLEELTKPIAADLLASYDLGEVPREQLTPQDAADAAFALLQVNYRVSVAEMVLLGAVANDSTVSALCALSCDWPKVASCQQELQRQELQVVGEDD